MTTWHLNLEYTEVKMILNLQNTYSTVELRAKASTSDSGIGTGHIHGRLDLDHIHVNPQLTGNHLLNLQLEIDA